MTQLLHLGSENRLPMATPKSLCFIVSLTGCNWGQKKQSFQTHLYPRLEPGLQALDNTNVEGKHFVTHSGKKDATQTISYENVFFGSKTMVLPLSAPPFFRSFREEHFHTLVTVSINDTFLKSGRKKVGVPM